MKEYRLWNLLVLLEAAAVGTGWMHVEGCKQGDSQGMRRSQALKFNTEDDKCEIQKADVFDMRSVIAVIG